MADLPVDVTILDDAAVKALGDACADEASRRSILTGMPNQAVSCAYQYKTAGGDPQDIITAVMEWVNAHGA